MKGLFDAIEKCALQKRRRIALGSTQATAALIESLNVASRFANVVAVGAEVPGVESVRADSEEAAADQLMSLARSGAVDAIIRGQIYYTHYHRAMRRHFGFKRDLMCPCLLRDLVGNEWFITPVVHHDDATNFGRSYLASQAAKICTKLGIEPVIGILAADNERGYLAAVDASLDDAEVIATDLSRQGYACNVYPLRIDLAARECNIVVPMDGIIGNFICRSLSYLGGATLVGGFSLTPKFVSIDTSRSSDQFLFAIMSAVAMSNIGGMPVTEYSEAMDAAEDLS